MKKRHGQHHWLVLALIFSALVALVFFLDQHSLTGQVVQVPPGSAVQTISYLPAGEELFFEVRNILGLKDATFSFSGVVKDGKVTFEEKDVPFSGKVYSSFVVSSPIAEKVSSMAYSLKLNQVDLRSKGFHAEQIKLYVNGKEQDTVMTSQKDSQIYYTVTTSEMGEYVIGTAAEEIVAEAIPAEDVEEAGVMKEGAEIAEEKQAIAGRATATEASTGWLSKVKMFFRNLFD